MMLFRKFVILLIYIRYDTILVIYVCMLQVCISEDYIIILNVYLDGHTARAAESGVE